MTTIAKNVVSYEINNPLNQDSIFTPLTLTNGIFTSQLDTGNNHMLVRFIGIQDTVVLSKDIYYFPGSIMNQNTYNISVTTDTGSIGTKLYVNNQFVKQINSFSDNIPVFKGENTLKFTKFGYVDSLVIVDSSVTVNISLHLFPHSYSSPTDSNIINFPAQGRIQYRKNVTVMDSAMKSIISMKQFDGNFSALGLIPKSREFEFRHLNAPNWSNIKTAITLDQMENLSRDSIYLMKVSGDTILTKIYFDSTGVIAGYDSVVQKLTYNYINFDKGTVTKEALVIMKRQVPKMNNINLNINQNDSLIIALSTLLPDPDSIKNDITYSVSVNQNNLSLSISGNNLIIKPNYCWTGNTNFILRANHDRLEKGYSFPVSVVTNINEINCAPTIINEMNQSSTIDIYPNPSIGSFIVSFNSIQNETIQITVFNMLGEKIYEEEVKNISNTFTKQINLGTTSTGVYFIKVQIGDTAYNKKIIISN